MILVSVIITAAVSAAGSILSVAFTIAPATTAHVVCKHLSQTLGFTAVTAVVGRSRGSAQRTRWTQRPQG